ncbi:hypothetical protein LTR08_003666 [Meristemomyces frigidus]|nr:hypothetical protein LTR08_003666 [Meristemomyces frigidus]
MNDMLDYYAKDLGLRSELNGLEGRALNPVDGSIEDIPECTAEHQHAFDCDDDAPYETHSKPGTFQHFELSQLRYILAGLDARAVGLQHTMRSSFRKLFESGTRRDLQCLDSAEYGMDGDCGTGIWRSALDDAEPSGRLLFSRPRTIERHGAQVSFRFGATRGDCDLDYFLPTLWKLR